MTSTNSAPARVLELIDHCAAELERAGVYFGHGTDNAGDEAAALVLAAAGLRHDEPGVWTATLDAAARARVDEYLRRRIEARLPLPYITGEAWFAGLRFRVDSRVLVPRSPFAELIGARFEPWLRPGPVRRILDLGTGSGCIAVAAAFAFPLSEVVASDVSAGALSLAAHNVRMHGLGDRVRLVEADVFDGIEGRFDLILSNPPYVPAGDLPELPAEYGHEPALGLVSGADGMDMPRRILQDAGEFLHAGGLLALEVGAGWPALEAAFPRLPFIWPELESGGEGIALLDAQALQSRRIA